MKPFKNFADVLSLLESARVKLSPEEKTKVRKEFYKYKAKGEVPEYTFLEKHLSFYDYSNLQIMCTSVEIEQYDLNGNKIAEFPSITKLCKELDISRFVFYKHLKGKVESINNFKFKRKNG